MSEHIEWAIARETRPQLATAGWIAENSDDEPAPTQKAIVLATGSSTMAIEGTIAELYQLGVKIAQLAAKHGAYDPHGILSL